jgi:hypothetical protein
MTDVYKGSLLGVHAEVTLRFEPGDALVKLHGAPLCGQLSGIAKYSENGSVILDPQLDAALKRRFCKVRSVMLLNDKKLRVTLELPFFGRRELLLDRIIHYPPYD